jgi:hypothetical protein
MILHPLIGRKAELNIEAEGSAEACFSIICLQILAFGRCVPDLMGRLHPD